MVPSLIVLCKTETNNALFNGRHVVNAEAVEGTGLKEVCHLAKGAAEFKRMIKSPYERPFTFLDLQLRREKLLNRYNNLKRQPRYKTDI